MVCFSRKHITEEEVRGDIEEGAENTRMEGSRHFGGDCRTGMYYT